MDYMIHTLDFSTALLNNPKAVGTREALSESALKNMLSIIRRLYRLFAHAYFNHKEIFLEFESSLHLCERFTLFVSKFDMMPAKLFCLPLFTNRILKKS